MSDFRAIREEIENLMDLLEGYQTEDEELTEDEDVEEFDEEDELDEDDDEELEEQYRRAKRRTVFAGGSGVGKVIKTGRGKSAAELRKAARKARKYRKTKGRSAYLKGLKRRKRLRKQPKFQRMMRRHRQAAIKKGTRQESVDILDRIQGLLEALQEATGYEFGIEDGELFYYDDE